jgi:ABC-type arginine transport system permease subunit
MFAGLPELVLILVVFFAAWHVVRLLNRPRPQTPPREAQRPPARPVIAAEDLVSCRVCGTYIAISAQHCGRADCPQPH